MKENNWTVYCHITNDGRRYIGITSNAPKKRWDNGRGYRSNQLFYNYINKYGWDSLKHIIIEKNLTEIDAKQLEIELIKKYNTQNKKYGFNLTAGGDSGYSPCEETRKKMSIARKKRIISEETKRKISNSTTGIKNGFYGKHHTAEVRKKISELAKGRPGCWKGKKLSEVHKKKIGLKSLHRGEKKVRCVETQKEYFSIGEAARDYNIANQSSIGMCCSGKRKTAAKLHWEFI